MIEQQFVEFMSNYGGWVVLGIFLLPFVGLLIQILFTALLDKRRKVNMTITEKWQRGLIGQPKSRSKIPPQYSSYQPTINLPSGIKEIGGRK